MAYTFTQFGQEVDNVMSGFAVQAASVVDMQIQRPVYLALVIWAFVMGLLIMNGWTRTTFKEFVYTALKIGLLAMVGLNSFRYLTYVIDIGGELDSWFISMLPNSLGSDTPTSVWDSVTQLWAGSWDLVNRMLSIEVGWGIDSFFQSIVIILLAVVVGVGVLFMTNMALTLIVVNKVILAVMLGFGPLFICFAMFDWTKSLFSGWLRTVLSVIVTFVLFSAAVMLALAVLDPIVGQIEVAAEGDEDGLVFRVLELAGTFLVICLSFAGLFRWIPMVAHNITGAIAGLVPPGLLASSRMTAGGALRTAGVGAGTASLTMAAGGAAAAGIAGSVASASAWAEGRRGERAAQAANMMSLASGSTLEKGLNALLGGKGDSGSAPAGSSMPSPISPNRPGGGGAAFYDGGSSSAGTAGSAGSVGAAGKEGSASNGLSGAAGASGVDGATGASGSGYTGAAGAAGSTGMTGSSGVSGYAGSTGASGAMGAVGAAGATGLHGTGSDGQDGYNGSTGAAGSAGATGIGLNGLRGEAGLSGTDGSSGMDGQTTIVPTGGSTVGSVSTPAASAMKAVHAGGSFESSRSAAETRPASQSESAGTASSYSSLSSAGAFAGAPTSSGSSFDAGSSPESTAASAANRFAASQATAAAEQTDAAVNRMQNAAATASNGQQDPGSAAALGHGPHADWQDRMRPDVRVAGPLRTGGSTQDVARERPSRESLTNRYGKVIGNVENLRDKAADAIHATTTAVSFAKAKATSDAWNRFATMAPKTALFAQSYAAARAARKAQGDQVSLAQKTVNLKSQIDKAVNVVEGRAPMVGKGGFYAGYVLGADNNDGPGDFDGDGD